MLLLSSADFFKINVPKQFFQEHYQSVNETVWIQIRKPVVAQSLDCAFASDASCPRFDTPCGEENFHFRTSFP